MTWKFVEIWSSTNRLSIDGESTAIRRGVPVGLGVTLGNFVTFLKILSKLSYYFSYFIVLTRSIIFPGTIFVIEGLLKKN